jgi:peptidyl-tRNA hydrolase, PTH1 family
METKDIKAIVGLGNPGPKFASTRHNIGFMVVDFLAKELCTSWATSGNMEVANAIFEENGFFLIKPQTFMNNSGNIVPFLKRNGIGPENTLIVHDELDAAFGKIKERFGGSARGHNGLKSFIEKWGSDFHRLRIGINRPENKDHVSDYVLQNFSETKEQVEEIVKLAAANVLQLIS